MGTGKPRVKPSARLSAPTGRPRFTPWVVFFCYLFAFASGSAALTYELAWAQMLTLTFGSTSLAASSVIAGFLGGMGLGAWFYHLVDRRVTRPLALYGMLELGIALTTALITLSMYALPEVFAQLVRGTTASWSLALLRFGMVFVIVLIPSALMGATFPALCTVLIDTVGQVDRRLGMIYGINTIGGAFGALLGGIFLIERLGLTATVRVANVVNLAVACGAFLLLAFLRVRAVRPEPQKDTALPTELHRWVVGLVILVSGFATLGYEIVWFRALRYVVGNSTYALTTVLVIFLVGLGAGSLLLRWVVKRGSPERTLALTQCGIAALAMLAVGCESLLLSSGAFRDHFSIYSHAVQATPWWGRLLLDAGVAVVTMTPATLLMGLLFPLASRLYLGDVRKLSRRTGSAYLLANIGSVLGAVTASLVLLPLLGTIGGTKALAMVNLALGGLVFLAIGRKIRKPLMAATIPAALVVVLAILLPASLPLHGERPDDTAAEVVFLEEGDLATVQVLQNVARPDRRSMTIDGYQIGWSKGFRGSLFYRKQVMLAHLPMALEPGVRTVLNVGLGSAATAEALTKHPELEVIDCVEINPAVVQACELFPESAALNDERVDVIVDDAVNYLLRTPDRYDLIISDGKQHPFFAGNAALLCREFYQYALARLTDRGLFVQWAPLGMLSADLRINLRTFCDVFPYVEIFYFPPSSLFAIGSLQPLAGRRALDEVRYAASVVRDELAPYFIENANALYARWVAGKARLESVLGPGPISAWDRMILDFSTFKTIPADWNRAHAENLRLLLAAEQALAPPAAPTFVPPDGPWSESSRLLRRAFAEQAAGRLRTARDWAAKAVETHPDDPAARVVLQLFEQDLRAAGARSRDQ